MAVSRVMTVSMAKEAALDPVVSDAELAVRCRKGDEEAFEILYSKYRRPLFNYILRMVGDYDRSLDLCHDAFLRVITARRYEPIARFSTWLYRIATNLCINEMKKKRPLSLDEKLEQGEMFDTGTRSPLDDAANGQLAERIKSAVDGLTDIQRAVFTMRHYQGLSYQEIALVLRCPVGTVKSRLNSAVSALRKTLREEIREVLPDDMQGC